MAAPGQQTPPFPAPQDQDQKNIIDKLANFVARNGTKFEEMTKSKQKDNPKFAFLFGGDFFNYYKWKVSVEIAQSKLVQPPVQSQGQSSFPNAQAAIVQQAIVQQSIQSAPWQQTQQVSSVQHQPQPQATQQPYLSSTDLNIQDFENHLVKIMQSCTKENISNGKHWIFKHCKTDDHYKQVADYMLLRVTGAGMGFLHKLHIIYLINDVLHYAMRKSNEDVKPVLQEVIVPIYCDTFVGESSENQQRLEKVIRIWETNSYFDSEIIEKMKNAEETKKQLDSSAQQGYSQDQLDYNEYDQSQYAAYDTTELASAEVPENQEVKDAQDSVGTDEKENVREGDSSDATMEGGVGVDKQPIPTTQQAIPTTEQAIPINEQAIPTTEQAIPKNQPIPTTQQPPVPENVPFGQVPQHPHHDPNYHYPPANFPYDRPPDFHQFPPPGFPRPPFNQPPPGFNGHMPPFDPNFVRGPPPGYPPGPPQQFDYNHGYPDQRPPTVHDYHHGQAGAPMMEEAPPPPPPPPQAMYYELPAGLMVPLIKSPDVNYEPLNENDVKLPPPQPPSERLIAAVEAFYSPPSHESPRNSEGWEAGALHEFYKIKLPFIKQREVFEKVEKVKEMAKKKVEQKSPDDEKRSRSRSRSRSRPRSRSRSRSRSRARSKSFSPRRRSRSRSPPRRRSRSRSRSKSKSRSRSPRRRRSRSRSRSHSRSKSRSPRRRRSVSPPARRRSPTPPSFAGAYLQQSLNTRIDESNVGHKLLKKMGWEGAGLGKAEQGIQDPIKQGDVRDKQDMYKGIGIDINDAFAQYRKNMSYTFNRPRRERR